MALPFEGIASYSEHWDEEFPEFHFACMLGSALSACSTAFRNQNNFLVHFPSLEEYFGSWLAELGLQSLNFRRLKEQSRARLSYVGVNA